MFLDNMENSILEQALNKSSALGMLRGHLMGEMLYWDDITVRQFNHSLQALNRSYEMCGDVVDDFDMDRIKNRALELGITIS
jgi:hypothetical protein